MHTCEASLAMRPRDGAGREQKHCQGLFSSGPSFPSILGLELGLEPGTVLLLLLLCDRI